jgi:PAS domain S-box-containing protein
MRHKIAKPNATFIIGGGEMGELIRQKDWRKTSVGIPEKWPQSLRTTLSIILHSKFPMFLFWGPELICFYNDAYRPSLGNNGKHPNILGSRAEDYWSEIWADIKPIIDQVLAGGEASWSEDQLLPIYRNGKMEDVYWTFSYSAVHDESGKPSGVFVTCTETTKQVTALKNLEESEDIFHTLADNISQLAWMADEKGLIYWYNQRWYDYTGTTFEQMQGWGWQKVHHEDHLDRVVKHIQHSWDTGETWEDTFPLRGQDGQYRWFLSRAFPIKDADGKVLRWIGTNTDITTQKTAEEKIRISEERFRKLADQAPMWVWITDLNINVLYANDQVLRFIGLAHYSEFTGQMWQTSVHPQDLTIVMSHFQNAVSTQTAFEFEARVKNARTGDFEWFYIKGVPRVETDIFTGFIGTAINIERQKSFARELEQQVEARTNELKSLNEILVHKNELLTASENFNRSLTEISPTMVVIHDIEKNKPIFLNKTYLDFVGYDWESVEEQGSKFINAVIHPNDLVFFNDILRKVLKSKAGEVFEGSFRRKNARGEWVTFLNRLTAFKRNGKNEVTQIMGVAIDISDLKKAEDFLQQKNQDLEKMNKELQSFAYISSHDLQEPLRKIQTFISRISELDKNNLSQKGKGYFERIETSATRMRKLIDDLLLFSNTNKGEKIFEITDLNQLFERVNQELLERIEEKNALIQFGDLPTINVIPFQIQQLFINLVGNALKYTKKDIQPLIKIDCETIIAKDFPILKIDSDKKYCKIAVSDNGLGFEQQYSESIFNLFQRLHHSAEYPGTGIGLAICKKIVENHEGFITAVGVPNKGATFTFFLPT